MITPLRIFFLLYGALAQLVERHDGIVEASGSTPLRSKNKRESAKPIPFFY